MNLCYELEPLPNLHFEPFRPHMKFSIVSIPIEMTEFLLMEILWMMVNVTLLSK